MFTVLLIWALAFLPLLNAIPTPSQESPLLPKRCTKNALQNPGFESGEYPWLAMVSGSWAERGVRTSADGGHEGHNFYWGRSNATVQDVTLTLSQSELSIPSGTTVDCSAWVASSRPGNIGATRVEVFLDGITCGSPMYFGTSGWAKVGGKVVVSGDSHTLAIVIVSDEAGPEGGLVWVDEASLEYGC